MLRGADTSGEIVSQSLDIFSLPGSSATRRPETRRHCHQLMVSAR